MIGKRGKARARFGKRTRNQILATVVERLETRVLLSATTTGADFYGQLGGWLSVTPSGDASGATDTANIQTALNEVGTNGFSSTLYLNSGAYYINQSLVFRGKTECNIVGADPASTVIQWAGPTSNSSGNSMLIAVGNTICQVSRITLDGENQIDDGILDGYRPKQLITNSLGTLSNTAASGLYGCSFTTQNAPVKILGIQRWIPANTTTTQTHLLELVDATNSNVLFSGTLSAGYVGGASGHFSGVGFSGDVTLAANHTYYLLSQENNGGDSWYDDTTSFSPDHVLVRTINGSVDNVGGTVHIVTSGEHSFGPMNIVEDTSSATGDAEKFPTNNSFSDLHIQNFQGTAQAAGHGFTGGIFALQVSETLLERDTFSNCGTNTGNVIGTGGGIYLFGQNTIDFWIRDCEFDHNSVGVVTNFGGYSTDLDNCVFNSDSLLDLYLPQGYSTAVRNCTSIDSNQFVQGNASTEVILQNDQILDPSSATLAPISLPGSVQLTLYDTTFRNNAGYSGPDVVMGTDCDILSAGNTFGVSPAFVPNYNPYSQEIGSLLRTLDTQIVSLTTPAVANLLPQTLPSAPAKVPWTPIELVPTGNANTDVTNVKNAISSAKASIDAGATGAVIHLQDRNSSGAYTSFSLNSTITIPAGYVIDLVGDGEAYGGGNPGTSLAWAGATGGTMIDLGGATLGVAAGPSLAGISNLGINSGSTAGDAIRVENADQPGGSVYSDDMIVGVAGSDSAVEYTQNGVFADGLSNTNVQLLDYQADAGSNVKVVGGAASGSGGQVGVFMGGGESEAVQYDVSNGGKLLVEDQYLEEDSGLTNQWARVSSGTYTVQGAEIKANVAGVDASHPPISVSGTSNVSVLSSATAAGIILEPGAASNVLAAGNGQWGSASGNGDEMGPLGGPIDYGAQSQAALVENSSAPDQINANIPDTSAFLRQMLAQTRTFAASALPVTRTVGATDVRLFNINVTGAVNDVHLVGSPNNSAAAVAVPTTPAAPTSVTAFPAGAGGSQIDVSYQPGGVHLVVPNAGLFNAHSGVSPVNNYTGLVGMQFTTGARPILVTQLGRFVVGGDTLSHTLEIVRVSDLSAIAQATLQTSSAQANNFAYVSLATPVTLATNTTYYLVTSETSGGDSYIPGFGVFSTSIVKSIDGIVKYDSTNGWQPNLNGSVDSGVVDLVGEELPDMAGEGQSHGVQTGALIAGIGNYEGMRFTTGVNPVTVTNLGRWIAANVTTTQSHALELVDQSNGTVIASATLAAGQSGGATGQFEYASLASPVTLLANHSYYFGSFENTTGDQVYSPNAMRTSNLISTIDGTATYNGSAWNFITRPGFTYGPLDLLGQVDTSAVTYTIYRSNSADMSGAMAVATGLTTTSYVDTNANTAAPNYYTVAAVNQSGPGAALGEAAASLGTALPTGWIDADTGSPPVAGTAFTNNGIADSFTVQGSGVPSSNQWNYVYEPVGPGGVYVPGTFTATVELTHLTQYGGPIAGYDEYRGALMIRDGLGANAHVAYVDVSATFTQGNGVNGATEPLPISLQLRAVYNSTNKTYSISGYYLDYAGNPVQPASAGFPITISNPATLYVGMATDSNGAAGLTTATFTNFDVVYGNDQAPSAPGNISPANGAIVAPGATLTAGAFSDPDSGDSQAASEWVVTRVSDGAVIYDSGIDTVHLTSITVPVGALTPSVAYSWNVRYKDNHGAWSSYSAPTSFTVRIPPDLSVTLGTAGLASPAAKTVSFTLNYQNHGAGNSTGAYLTQTLPANTTFNSAASAPGWSLSSGTTYIYTIGALGAGVSGTPVIFSADVVAPIAAGTQIVDAATIADDGASGPDANIADNSATDIYALPAFVSTSLSVSGGGTTAVPGKPITYNFIVRNDGVTAVSGVGVADVLPPGINLFSVTYSATPSNGATGYTPSGSGAINDTVSLPAGSSIGYSISGNILSSQVGNLTLTASAATAAGVVNAEANVNGSSSTNQASSTLSLTPAVELGDVINGANPLHAGQQDVYTIVVTNFQTIAAGSDAVAATISTDALAAFTGVHFSTAVLYTPDNAVAPSFFNPSGVVASGAAFNDTFNLSSGSIIEFQITGTVATGATGTISNTATVADSGFDVLASNNASSVTAAVVSASLGSVVGRSLFYANSFWDAPTTSNPTFSQTPDTAVPTDKLALMPGQSARFNNYSSYTNGINGVFVDITGDSGTISAGDFSFAVGSGSPVTWSGAPTPTTVSLYPGKGINGSDRVQINWASGTIVDEWLQVTALATKTDTNLAVPDVFYFGNAPGDVGNSITDAFVDSTDEIAARNDVHTTRSDPGTLENPHDFDRNSRVESNDQIFARGHTTTRGSGLLLITPSTPGVYVVSSAAASQAFATPKSAAIALVPSLIPFNQIDDKKPAKSPAASRVSILKEDIHLPAHPARKVRSLNLLRLHAGAERRETGPGAKAL